MTYYLYEYRWLRISDEQNQHKECLKCAKVQVQEEAADDWETISDEVYWVQNVRECVHWRSMNSFK